MFIIWYLYKREQGSRPMQSIIEYFGMWLNFHWYGFPISRFRSGSYWGGCFLQKLLSHWLALWPFLLLFGKILTLGFGWEFRLFGRMCGSSAGLCRCWIAKLPPSYFWIFIDRPPDYCSRIQAICTPAFSCTGNFALLPPRGVFLHDEEGTSAR